MVSQFQTNDRHQKKKRFLGELHDFPAGSMAVGRLDETSEGLLIITTNGKLSHLINNSGLFEKEYHVQVDGIITDAALEKLATGVTITVDGDDYLTQPCIARPLNDNSHLPPTRQRIRDNRHGPTSWIGILLKEGKFRQVRKMTSAVGYPTLRLARVRIGAIEMPKMESGKVIEITDQLEKISNSL
jgi:23S rRNA pseudouridine2457 synthase